VLIPPDATGVQAPWRLMENMSDASYVLVSRLGQEAVRKWLLHCEIDRLPDMVGRRTLNKEPAAIALAVPPDYPGAPGLSAGPRWYGLP